MTKTWWFAGRVIPGAALSAALVLGCWRVEDLDKGDAGAGGSGGSLGGTDLEVCGGACSLLIDCDIELDSSGCKTTCADPVNASLVSCFRAASATCDGLSACALATVCQNAGPSGSASCQEGLACSEACAGNTSPQCACNCAAQVSSADAASIYRLVVCSAVRCDIECGPEGDPTSCDSCLQLECEDAVARCG